MTDEAVRTVRHGASRQQPEWDAHPTWPAVMGRLADAAPVCAWAEVARLGARMERVAAGEEVLLQVGDCAESIYDASRPRTAAKAGFIADLRETAESALGVPVVGVGRMAGQFAKPRSSPTERVGEDEMPSFFGHMVNSELADGPSRRPDPRRMLWAHAVSSQVADDLRTQPGESIWLSHEALVLDYESMAVRPTADGRAYLASTHFPWIGERTRQVDAGHVRLLSGVANPVAVKIGPLASPEEVVELCRVLDPDRLPGRLTLVLRLGLGRVEETVPGLVEAVRRAGHRPVWVSDPVHGNTRTTTQRTKVRDLETVTAEAVGVRDALRTAGEHPGGLHLEATPDDVVECLGAGVLEADVDAGPGPLCDPRLNAVQTHLLVSAWCR